MPVTEFQNYDEAGDGSDALRSPTYVNTYVLAANTAQAVAIPSVGGKRPGKVIFSATAPFAVAYTPSGTALVASLAGKTDGTGCEISPIVRSLSGVESLSLIAPTAAIVSLTYTR